MGAATAGGEVGGNFLSKALGVAGVFAIGQQVVHGCPHGGIRSKKAEFEEESNPIGAFIAFVQCTHSNFFPRGRRRWGDKTIYSRGEWSGLSVDSCIEVVKGLYGVAAPRTHGGTERFEGKGPLLAQTAREKWGTLKIRAALEECALGRTEA